MPVFKCFPFISYWNIYDNKYTFPIIYLTIFIISKEEITNRTKY